MQQDRVAVYNNISIMTTALCTLRDWAGLIGSLLGTVIGALIAIQVTKRQLENQRTLEREKHLRDRYEQLHRTLSTVSSEAALIAAHVIVGSREHVDTGSANIGELNMLIALYAPVLSKEGEDIARDWSRLFTALLLPTSVVGVEVASNLPSSALALSKSISTACRSGQDKLKTLFLPLL